MIRIMSHLAHARVAALVLLLVSFVLVSCSGGTT
jgi:hypothetical protein